MEVDKNLPQLFHDRKSCKYVACNARQRESKFTLMLQ